MNKISNIISGLFSIIFILIFVLSAQGIGPIYTVDETQQAVITQFGKLVGEPKTEAGLYFKLPFVQKTNYFDKRILEWDGDPNEIPTREKRNIFVDTTARWKIKDPLKFMQSVMTEGSAQTLLDDIIDGKTREVISSHDFIEAIMDTNRLIEMQKENKELLAQDIGQIKLVPIEFGREGLSKEILLRASKVVPSYGIEIIDVRIKRISYVQRVQNKVYERMISERKRAAEKFRSEGQGKKAEIQGQMSKELEEIRAEAYRKSQEIKGKADAKAIKIYANAYNKDPDFFAFLKTLESYKKTINSDTVLILSTDNEFYELLKDAKGRKGIQ